MHTTCPKFKHERQSEDNTNPGICPGCGIIFSKWMKQQFSLPDNAKNIQTKPESNTFILLSFISSSLFSIEDKVNPIEIDNSFMHRINLAFHEAGHIIFIPFGWFMTKLGGTPGQLLIAHHRYVSIPY